MEAHPNQPKSERRRMFSETWPVSIFLLVLLCVYFWKVIFGGQVLVPTDMIFQFPFFKEAAPPGFEHASNTLLSDPVLKFYPWHTATREALQDSQFPFWNPYIYSGAPLFANGESAILYPINLLGYLLPLNTALAFSAILRTFVAGLGTFLFLRALKVNTLGSVVAALAFMFGGSMIVWLNYPVGNAYAWMPMMFFLGERLVASRKLFYVPLTSIVIATQILGGHYQTSFIMLVPWGLYCLYRISCQWRDERNTCQFTTVLLALAGATLLGIVMVAVQLVPFWEWLGQSNEVQLRLEESSSSLINPSFWKKIVLLATLGLPNLFGNPTWGSPTSFFYSNYIEQMSYMGIVPLALAILAVLATKRGSRLGNLAESEKNNLILFLAGTGLFFLGMALELPGLSLVNRLPVFSIVAPNRYRLVFTFCVAVLAGIGAERIFCLPEKSRLLRYLSWGLLVFSGIGASLLIIIRWALTNLKDTLVSYERIHTLYPILIKAFSPSTVSMYIPILIALAFAGVLILYQKQRLSPRWSIVTSIALILIDLFIFGTSFNPAILPSQVFPETESTRFLEQQLADQGLAHIVALEDNLPPNTGMPYRFAEIAGVDFPSQRYAELAQKAGGSMQGHFRIIFSTLEPNLINLMNVRYVIAGAEAKDLPDEPLREIYHNAFVKIYENPDALPRAYVVHQVQVLDDGAQILEALASPSFNPESQIILEEPPPVALSPTSSANDSVQVVAYHSQGATFRVTLGEDGFLFTSDAFFPGWRAFVDNEETKLYRANYAFRAIYVPRGEHLVKFTYTPSSFGLGLVITLVGLALTLIILGSGLIRQIQRNRHHVPTGAT